jgi:diguanylate cyclase (GGDEF)-like protein
MPSSAVAIPLAVDGRVGGLLCISCDGRHRYHRAELQSLAALADLAGMAFAKAWAHRAETDLVAQLQTLASRAPDIVAAPTLDAALAAVLQTARELTRSAGAEIALLAEDGLRLDLHRAAGEEGREAARMVLEPPVLVADPDSAGGRRPVVLADPISGEGPLERACRRSGVRSLAAVPVVHRGDMLGTLYVVDKREELEPGYHWTEYSQHDVVTLETLAVVAGAAVQGLRLLQRLDNSALIDPLTGLPNVNAYQRIAGERPIGDYSVLAIDVDNLKTINDEGGHEAGDAVLRMVGEALRALVGTSDFAARTGGDEFVVVVRNDSATPADALSRRVQRFLYGSPVPHGQARVSVGASHGHAGDPVEATRVVAEAMLLRAKAAGGDCTIWPPTGGTVAPGVASWAETIDAALVRGGLRTVFQPIVRISDGCLVGMEALSRPGGLPAHASVEELFAVAQRLGRMRDLDWACRRQAVESASRLPRGVPIFLNVSVGALCDPMHAVDQMQLLLDWGSLRPRDVVLEITERERVSDTARLTEVVAEYRAAGFRFAVDDLGEGHGSMATLVAISPEFQKLAKAMLSRGDSAIAGGVAALVGFAGKTSGEVIAEGIEDADDLEWAAARGIGLAQGYGICRPIELARAAALIRRGRLDVVGRRRPCVHHRARPVAGPWARELAWPLHVARRSRVARS